MFRDPKTYEELESAGNVALDYEGAVDKVGSPLSCIVSVYNSMPTGDHVILDIDGSSRSTAMFKYEDGSYGYRALSHVLLHDGEPMYGLSCSGSGDVEAYTLLGEDTGALAAELIAERTLSAHVLDPMFAFVSHTDLYIVFNDPTDEAVSAGTKLRQPVASDDDSLLMASGAPVAFKFDTVTGKVTRVLRKMSPVRTYVTGLVDDPNLDVPALLIANVLREQDEETDRKRPTFGSFIDRFFDDGDDFEEPAREPMPFGVSFSHLKEKSNLVTVPFTGSDKMGIAYVSIAGLPEGAVNNIRLVEHGEDDDGYEEMEKEELASR